MTTAVGDFFAVYDEIYFNIYMEIAYIGFVYVRAYGHWKRKGRKSLTLKLKEQLISVRFLSI